MTPSLRHGYTTGACAAAAALGAARMLREQRRIASVELRLPAGFAAVFELHGQRFDPERATCFVVKDAGDDPDVTDGVEVHAEVSLGGTDWRECPSGILIEGGTGIGRVTKPGLAVPVGESAINPVPRRMITEAVQSVFTPHASPRAPSVTISIPDGEERSRQTLNARLGIVGGLSILGTTGVVRPLSHGAWTDTLETALDVALAAGVDRVVLSTGRTSEGAAQELLGGRAGLPEEAFIMMGDFVGHALAACRRRGFPGVILCAQFAKLVKIASGFDRTHVRDSRLELAHLARWARESGLDEAAAKAIESANTARQAWLESPFPGRLADLVAARALRFMEERMPGTRVGILLVGYDGRPAGRFGAA